MYLQFFDWQRQATSQSATNDLLHNLMLEVCLVLAPDVNFFLYSRKQGLPCWRSLFFSFLFPISLATWLAVNPNL